MPVGIEWFWLVGIGVMTQLGQIWITEGLTILPAAQASSINYAQVLFAIIWGLTLFKESLDKWIVLGAFLVFIATLISISARKEPASE